MALELKNREMCSQLEVIDKARIPIIKFEHAATRVPIDISFDIEGGLTTGTPFASSVFWFWSARAPRGSGVLFKRERERLALPTVSREFYHARARA